jgi:hypothetical protein
MNPQVLRIVRFAMLAMLLVFVAVAWNVRSHQAADLPPTASDLGAIRYVGFGLCAAALAGLAVLRGIRQRAPVEKRATLSLIGTALSEGAALLGAVYYFMGGDLLPFAVGLLVFLLSWSILPADPEAV